MGDRERKMKVDRKKRLGTEITQMHAMYKLTYGMMRGIMNSVGNVHRPYSTSADSEVRCAIKFCLDPLLALKFCLDPVFALENVAKNHT